MFQMMGMGANRAYDEIVFARLSEGFTAKGYDGKAFFHGSHPVGDKGKNTFSNLGTKKFSETNFSDALTALKTVKAANGKPWGFGQKLVLVCHPKHEVTVRKVLTLQKTAAGAANIFYNAAEVVSSALLTNRRSLVPARSRLAGPADHSSRSARRSRSRAATSPTTAMCC